MLNPFTKDKSVLQHPVQKLGDTNSTQMSDVKNVRLRHSKSNTSSGSTSNPAHFILSTGDLQSNEKNTDVRFIARNRHNNIQIIFMAFTALSYLLHTLRAYIPASVQANSHFWSTLTTRPITRVYTTDLRPSVVVESLLLRLAENWQTFWLLYVLSYIPRRTIFGYVYRNPDIFNAFLYFLLISALSLQTISQSSLSPEVSCSCLCLSLIFLLITCRLIPVKLLKYENKYKSAGLSIDFIIIRYFLLNSLFLYTTSIAYLTTCAFVEYIGFYLDPNGALPASTSNCTTIGLAIIFFFLLTYFLLDRFIYENEFWSIWTPYLFIAYAFICPPFRQLSLGETNNLNYYLLWALFSVTVLIICVRLYRQISIKFGPMKTKIRISSHIEQITSGMETK